MSCFIIRLVSEIAASCLIPHEAAELLVIGGCDAEFQEIGGSCESLSSSTRSYNPILVSELPLAVIGSARETYGVV